MVTVDWLDEVDGMAESDEDDVDVDVELLEELFDDVVDELVEVDEAEVATRPAAMPAPSPRNAATESAPAMIRERAAAWRRGPVRRFGPGRGRAAGRSFIETSSIVGHDPKPFAQG